MRSWWIQSNDVFVDVRVTLHGFEHNTLPYSSTRAFAGMFEVADGESRWQVELDSGGSVPRTDRAADSGLFIAEDDPLLMIEDAPGRFREEWVQCAPAGDVQYVRASNVVTVRVGDVTGVVWSIDGAVFGRIWCGDHSVGIDPSR